MSDTSDTSNPTSTRPTLRLKVTPRKPAPATTTRPVPQPQNNAKAKPGARWSDEYIDRMQADMNALTSR